MTRKRILLICLLILATILIIVVSDSLRSHYTAHGVITIVKSYNPYTSCYGTETNWAAIYRGGRWWTVTARCGRTGRYTWYFYERTQELLEPDEALGKYGIK
jgi:hypothetical protein